MSSKDKLEDFEKIVTRIMIRFEIRSLIDAKRRARNTGFVTFLAALLFIGAYKMGWLLAALKFGYDPNVEYLTRAMSVAGEDIALANFVLLFKIYDSMILNPSMWSLIVLPVSYILIGLAIGSFYEWQWYSSKIEDLKEEKKSKKLKEKQKRQPNRRLKRK